MPGVVDDFRSADTDGDGYVTHEEYNAYMAWSESQHNVCKLYHKIYT